MQRADKAAPPPIRRVGVILTILAILALVLIAWSSTAQGQVTCEVCISYKGGRQCRTAKAPSREEAMRTASDNACTFLAGSMAESINCSNTPPDRVTCEP
jgi:hypothetical protein